MNTEELKKLAQRMMRVFVGSNTLHYTADFRNTRVQENGKRVPQYDDVVGPPTLEEFIAHLEGKKGLLVIPITNIGACRWGVIDVDIYPCDAKKFAAQIARWGLPLIVQLTKSSGVHLGHFSPHTQSATDMRERLAEWAATLHCPPKVEIFPKQERLLDGEKGSGLNLPYFGGDEAKHNYAIDKEGNRLTVDQWLSIIERMPAKASYMPGQINVEAAADLLSKHWVSGSRDNLNLAVAGALLRAGVETDVVQQVLDASAEVGADPGARRSAQSVEQAMESGKRVPGYPKLVEILGSEDAAELMRLAGGKPPPDPIPFSFATLEPEWLGIAPPPLTYTIEPLLPSGVVGMLVAEGGAGKTTFGLRAAVSVAGGRDLFGLPTRQGRCVYIACEEHESGLRRRLYWIVNREKEKMRQENSSPESIELFEQNLLANLTLRSAVGYEMYLVSARNGEASQSNLVEALIEKLPRPLELLILDPISRLNGAEENSNQVGTALVNAAERIASEVGCTLMLCHHTGKAAAKDRDVGLYAARGASGFVDAARSSIRLLQADANDVKDFSNIPPGLVEAGDLVRVIQNKSNEGPKAKPFWLRRQELDFERFEPQITDAGQAYRKAIEALYNWFCAEGSKAFAPSRLLNNKELRSLIWRGLNITRDGTRDWIARAQSEGDLVPVDSEATKNDHALWCFRKGYGEDSM